MAVIRTNRGIEILVDDDKFEELNQYTWYTNGNGYAFRFVKITYKKKKAISMHRQLTNCPEGLVVDHINRNRVDNRLENLEIVTQEENMRRSRGKPRKYSKTTRNSSGHHRYLLEEHQCETVKPEWLEKKNKK